jgi:hypothetical protein
MQLASSAWALGIASSSVAVVLGCAVSDVKTVTELAPAVGGGGGICLDNIN